MLIYIRRMRKLTRSGQTLPSLIRLGRVSPYFYKMLVPLRFASKLYGIFPLWGSYFLYGNLPPLGDAIFPLWGSCFPLGEVVSPRGCYPLLQGDFVSPLIWGVQHPSLDWGVAFPFCRGMYGDIAPNFRRGMVSPWHGEDAAHIRRKPWALKNTAR